MNATIRRRGLWSTIATCRPFKRRAVRLNVSADYDAEVMRLLDTLRSRHGTLVVFRTPSNGCTETVILNNACTRYQDQAFGGETLLDALTAANEFVVAVQADAAKHPPASVAAREQLLAQDLELAEFRRIAARVVDERRRQIANGYDGFNDDNHTRGELLALARLTLFLGQCSAEAGGQVIAGRQIRTSENWWVREATYHALKFVDDPDQLLVHVACALLSEIARRERAARKAGA